MPVCSAAGSGGRFPRLPAGSRRRHTACTAAAVLDRRESVDRRRGRCARDRAGPASAARFRLSAEIFSATSRCIEFCRARNTLAKAPLPSSTRRSKSSSRLARLNLLQLLARPAAEGGRQLRRVEPEQPLQLGGPLRKAEQIVFRCDRDPPPDAGYGIPRKRGRRESPAPVPDTRRNILQSSAASSGESSDIRDRP